ncbi:DeoR family transcriptional regulator [Tetragenococcus halophilus subsp. flandriensis]|nr:DeoR family transcriptional regulator [Tetragenococcus halophilus subsp. flandriensis]
MFTNQFAYAQERKNKILSLLETQNRVQVSDLVELFQVSGSTVRTDLRELEKEQQLIRTHGGAIPMNQRSFEDFPGSREVTEGKKKIAKAAVNLIDDGDSIAIDTGTSCLTFAEALAHSQKNKLKIVTYDLHIATYLSENTDYEIVSVGGVVRNGFEYSAGEFTINQLKTFLVDKAIIATTAFTTLNGFSTPNVTIAELKAGLFEIARKKIVLCTKEKIGKDSFKVFANTEQANVLIVDEELVEKQQKLLKDKKVHLLMTD